MASNIDPELEEVIKNWAKTNSVAKRYLSNFPLIRGLYINVNEAKRVKHCLPNCKAALDLVIVDVAVPRTVKLCSQCNRKECKESCGRGDYEDVEFKSYTGSDAHYEGDDPSEANMQINVAPWSKLEDIDPCVGETYKVIGTVQTREYNDNTYTSISPKSMTLINPDEIVEEKDENEGAVKPEKDDEEGKIRTTIAHMLKSFDNVIDLKRWDAMLGTFKQNTAERIATEEFELGLFKDKNGNTVWRKRDKK